MINILKKTDIEIPIDTQAHFDLNRQKAIAENRRKAYQVKEQILIALEEIINTTISI
jgi:hypothetical protein